MANKKDHIIVFIISSLLFLTGVFFGMLFSQINVNEIKYKINDFEQNINSLEMSLLINNALKNETLSCNYLKGKLNETRAQLKDLGDKVINYESSAKIKDNDYKELKKNYLFARAKFWLMLEKLRNECNNNYTTILFFYKTQTPCPECKDEGIILSHLSSHNKNLYVIPLDADEDLLIIRIIKEAFKINYVPSIVINAKTKIEGLINETALLRII